MRGVSAWFFGTAVVYGALGVLLGTIMGATEDHSQLVTHAHMLLIGWVSFAIFGFFYHLFPGARRLGPGANPFRTGPDQLSRAHPRIVPDLLRQYRARPAPRGDLFHRLSAVVHPFRGHCPARGQGRPLGRPLEGPMSSSEVIPGRFDSHFPSISAGGISSSRCAPPSPASSPWRSPIGSALQDPQWSFLTVYLLAQPTTGAVVAKGFYRALGTVMGALWALLVLSLYAEAGVPFVLCMVIWLGLCIYAAARTRNFVSYGFLLAGYTALLVGYEGAAAPTGAWLIAVDRTSEILIGIALHGAGERADPAAPCRRCAPRLACRHLRRARPLRGGGDASLDADGPLHRHATADGGRGHPVRCAALLYPLRIFGYAG